MDQIEKLVYENDNKPLVCELCGGIMLYGGLGTYYCEKCKHEMLDEYGKVRLFLEENHGASIAEVSENTKVPMASINRMLKEARIQIAQGSVSYLKCEICNADIAYGSLCLKCEKEKRKKLKK